MRLTSTIVVVSAVTANAFSLADASEYSNGALEAIRRAIPALSERSGGDGGCPAIWTQIAATLQPLFLDTTVSPSQCNDDARAAIREAFHDAGTWDQSQGITGGADGSLINTMNLTTITNGVPDRELSRGENGGLTDISKKLQALQKSTFPSVSIADLIQFAASVAIVTCPGGPQIKTFVGRKDSNHPAPPGGLPSVHADASSLFNLFLAKGFTANELAALLGAHSTSKSFGQLDLMHPGTPQDSTPGIWDVKYYQDTLSPPASGTPFPSDTSLAAHPVVGKEFHGFIGSQGKWSSAFGSA